MVEILKDATALVAVVTLIEYYTGIDIPIPSGADALEIWTSIKNALEQDWEEAGNKSKWYNPASWKGFDFIGDLQASAFGIDRDNPGENFNLD